MLRYVRLLHPWVNFSGSLQVVGPPISSPIGAWWRSKEATCQNGCLAQQETKESKLMTNKLKYKWQRRTWAYWTSLGPLKCLARLNKGCRECSSEKWLFYGGKCRRYSKIKAVRFAETMERATYWTVYWISAAAPTPKPAGWYHRRRRRHNQHHHHIIILVVVVIITIVISIRFYHYIGFFVTAIVIVMFVVIISLLSLLLLSLVLS